MEPLIAGGASEGAVTERLEAPGGDSLFQLFSPPLVPSEPRRRRVSLGPGVCSASEEVQTECEVQIKKLQAHAAEALWDC